LKKARNFLESGTVNRSWQVFFPSSGGRPATQPLRKWPAHSLPPQSVREMTEICLRINFYFSFFRPPPLPKATQSINTHTFCSTYSQSPCNKNNFVPLIHKAPATRTILFHLFTKPLQQEQFCSTYSQSPCNKNNFVPLIHKAPATRTILFHLFTKPLQQEQFCSTYSQSPCNKHNLFTKPLQQAYFIHTAPPEPWKR